jgi:hypothetical protein
VEASDTVWFSGGSLGGLRTMIDRPHYRRGHYWNTVLVSYVFPLTYCSGTVSLRMRESTIKGSQLLLILPRVANKSAWLKR